EPAKVHALEPERPAPGLEPRQVEDVRHQAAQAVALVVDDAEESVPRRVRVGEAVAQRFGVALDGGERALDLVRDDRHQVRARVALLVEPALEVTLALPLAPRRPAELGALERERERVAHAPEEGALRP